MDECSDHEIIAANGSEETIINIEESNSEVATDPFVKSNSECNIYKVPEHLRRANPEAYTPQFISIGPFHHGNKQFSRMETHKRRYYKSFLSRSKIKEDDLFEKVKSWEKRARGCYAEPIHMSSDKFVELILVDGCFVVEYCMRRSYALRGAADHSIHEKLNFNVCSDLIKLENQLPFFVLEGLYEHYSLSIAIPQRERSFVDLSYSIFSSIYKHKLENFHYDPFYQECDHFVSLLWLYYIPPFYLLEQRENPPIDNKKIRSDQTANDLHEAGIKFHRMEINHWDGNDIMNIAFENGVLAISRIEILSDYETCLRNLMAFEQCHHPVNRYVTHFAVFMDRLINTDKDVNLLIKAGIISNHLGSNEDVTKIFNNISKNIYDLDKNYFNDVYVDMHKYCKARWHRWMFLLRRDYFNTPWAFISFVAASILLILTLIQTVFSGLSIIK